MPKSKAIVIPRDRVELAEPFSCTAFWNAFVAAVPTSGLILDWCEVRQIARKAGIACVEDAIMQWIPDQLHTLLLRYQRLRLPRGTLHPERRGLELLYFWLTKTTPSWIGKR